LIDISDTDEALPLHMDSMDSYVEPSGSLDVGNFDDVSISNEKQSGVDEMSAPMRGASGTHLAGLMTDSIDSNEERGTGGYHPDLKAHSLPDHKRSNSLMTASIDSNAERDMGGYHPELCSPAMNTAPSVLPMVSFTQAFWNHGQPCMQVLPSNPLMTASIDSNEERDTGGYHPGLCSPAMNTAPSMLPMVSFTQAFWNYGQPCMQVPLAKRPRWSSGLSSSFSSAQQPEVICGGEEEEEDDDDDMKTAPNENEDDESQATPSPVPSSLSGGGDGPPPPSPTSAAGASTTSGGEANEDPESDGEANKDPKKWERRRAKRMQAIQRIKEGDLYRAVQAKLRGSGAAIARAWEPHAHQAPLPQTNREATFSTQEAAATRAVAGGGGGPQPALRRPRTPDPEDRNLHKRPWESAVLQWRTSLHQLNATPPRDSQQASGSSTRLQPVRRSRRPRRGGL